MDGVRLFNGFEAGFWLLLAVAAAVAGQRTNGFTPLRQWTLVILLAGFGISDVWEIYSGVWWKPPALLLLKAVCLSGLIFTAGAIYLTRWRPAGKQAATDR